MSLRYRFWVYLESPVRFGRSFGSSPSWCFAETSRASDVAESGVWLRGRRVIEKYSQKIGFIDVVHFARKMVEIVEFSVPRFADGGVKQGWEYV
ncbi:hypothetical protein U1Q18_048955 [Sarracenia purpurea var. burkii]